MHFVADLPVVVTRIHNGSGGCDYQLESFVARSSTPTVAPICSTIRHVDSK
jgi:hypothetical protein